MPAAKAEALPRQAGALWLAVRMVDPPPDPAVLASLAEWAGTLTSFVVLSPGEGLLLEVRGSLHYFAGLAAIKARLESELERRKLRYRLATAPTPLAASWLARYMSLDVTAQGELAGAIGRLPLSATAWPEKVLLMLRQMGLKSIADCLRLPRGGFARRVGQARLDDLDRALGSKPDPRTAYEAPQPLRRTLELTAETTDRAVFVEALDRLSAWLEQKLRQRQLQIREIALEFGHLRAEPTRTRIRFVDPVHERERILEPLLARMERLGLAEPAIALSLATGLPVPLEIDVPDLLPAGSAFGSAVRSPPEFALVERLRGRFGEQSVYGIGPVAEHRPEHAWRRWLDRPPAGPRAGHEGASSLPAHERPLWLLPAVKRGQSPFSSKSFDTPSSHPVSGARSRRQKKGSDPFSETPFFERIESGWWDGQDVRRDYHVVVGPAGERLWFYRDCVTREWYLHGIFG